jgi:hypothetical protein
MSEIIIPQAANICVICIMADTLHAGSLVSAATLRDGDRSLLSASRQFQSARKFLSDRPVLADLHPAPSDIAPV